jgi:hypothetical protein
MLGRGDKLLIKLAGLLFAIAVTASSVLTLIAVQNNQADEFCVTPSGPAAFVVQIQGVDCQLVIASIIEQFLTFFLMIGVPMLLPIVSFLAVRFVRRRLAAPVG